MTERLASRSSRTRSTRYVTRSRLTRAARQLRTGDAPLTEIALRAGYESEFSFSRAFARAFGVAPRAYREEDEGGDAMNDFLRQPG